MAAVAGTFSDFGIVKGRKVARLVIEIPIEQADQALRALGGVPQPHAPQWVGIAPIDMRKVEDKPKRKMNELPIPNQVALTCEREAFQRFLVEVLSVSEGILGDTEKTAEAVRWQCGVNSRSEIVQGSEAAEKWFRLKADFDLWMENP